MSTADNLVTPLISATPATPSSTNPAAPTLVVATGFTPEVQEEIDEETQVVKIFNQAFSGTANLANLLPTGSFLTFQVLSPLVTNSGGCTDSAHVFTILTSLLLVLCGLSAFFLTLTDSFQATNGKIYYGFLTTYGLWSPFVKGGRVVSPAYALTLLDLLHAVLSTVVFATSTLLTEYVRDCFYPTVPALVYNLLPLTVGFSVSLIFILYPTKRHGIGYPAVVGYAAVDATP